jgi:hypothetical protein
MRVPAIRKKSGGAQSKFGAARVKVNNDHSICGIVIGSIVRRKNQKISMIGASMNCKEVGKKGMSIFLEVLINEQHLDFIGLQETIKNDYSQAFFR